MSTNNLPLLRDAISSARLESYRRSLAEDDLVLLGRYVWNTALSEALYPLLQSLEIALRNSVHRAAATYYRTDWWFDGSASPLRYREAEKVEQAKETLRTSNKAVEPGRVVAELTFGFWTSLLNVRYEQVLWPRLLGAAFPSMARRIRTRSQLSTRLNEIRKLRNRIFHHEPIWQYTDLARQHAAILAAIGWVSPPYRDITLSLDRFPRVLAEGPAPYRQRLTTALGLSPSS